MESSFKTIIETAQTIVIFLPNKPYLDQVAAALSLFLSLRDVKPVQIVTASPITVNFNRLIGVDKISSEAGNKNLVINISSYDAGGIDRVSYDVVDNQCKLTVIPKSGVNPPKEEQVKVSYEGVAADTVVLFGGATDTHFPQLGTKGLESAKMYHIGTRPLIVDPSRVIYTFAQPLASVSELTFFLMNEAQLTLSPDVATNLLMGIEEATQNYRSQSVTAETFEVTASLIRLGGRRLAGEGVDKSRYPMGSLPQAFGNKTVDEIQISQDSVASTSITDTPQEPLEEKKKESIPAPVFLEEERVKEESKDDLNPPDDWLQPKVIRGTSLN